MIVFKVMFHYSIIFELAASDKASVVDGYVIIVSTELKITVLLFVRVFDPVQ